jgi:hypothetical protein
VGSGYLGRDKGMRSLSACKGRKASIARADSGMRAAGWQRLERLGAVDTGYRLRARGVASRLEVQKMTKDHKPAHKRFCRILANALKIPDFHWILIGRGERI